MSTAVDFDDSPLFDDIDLTMDSQFEIPEELAPFDRGIEDEEVTELAVQAFKSWLAAHLKKQEITTPAPPFTTACEDEANMDDSKLPTFGTIKVRAEFFPEYPDPDDFQDGEANLEFRRQAYEADLGAAYAKAACDSCPIKDACLTASIVNADEYGVFGGWSEGARSLIRAEYYALYRKYVAFENAQAKNGYDFSSPEHAAKVELWAPYMPNYVPAEEEQAAALVA